MTDASHQLRIERRDERRIVAPYRGDIAVRLILTFVGFSALWAGIVVAGFIGAIPLWLAAIASFVVATTFYMPMHEATHGNVWGDVAKGRWVEDLVGTLSSFMVGISYRGHRISHMKHHAFTNDPAQDPDVFVDGPKRDLPKKFYGYTMVSLLLPLFAFVPATTRLLPKALREREVPRDADEDRYSFRFWLMRTAALIVAFAVGIGWEVLWLWFVPSLFVVWWLGFIFAWFPHHPSEGTQGRYVDTRVAVFPGSTILIRGHDHHALHHLFPRVVHYRLPKLWQEIGPDMTAKGVRTEGRALGATGPIVW